MKRYITLLTCVLALITATPVLAQPHIEFEWQVGLFQDGANWNDAFPDLFWGGPYEAGGIIRNSGDERLDVEASTDNEAFTVEPVQFQLEAGNQTQITVTFEAREPGHYVLTDTVTGLRMYLLVTHPLMAEKQPRGTVERFDDYAPAVEAAGKQWAPEAEESG